MTDSIFDIFHMVDRLINYPEYIWYADDRVFSETLDSHVDWKKLPALEEKVRDWSTEHPLLWNVGIGPGASFVPTLTRLLLERTKDMYGPYDHIIRVKLPSQSPSSVAAGRTTAQHQLAFDVLTELATLLETQLPEDIKQLAEEETYFGYCKLSDYLMLQAFGRWYIFGVAPDNIWMDPIFHRQPYASPILERVREALQGKKQLLLVENLHVPMSLDMLVFILGKRRPSVIQNRRWLISTTSKDVCEKSRDARGYSGGVESIFYLTPEYYYAPPFGDLLGRDWAMLIKEALLDAARSIYMALQDKGDEKFWLHIAQRCLYYGILYHPLIRQGAGGRQARNTSSVTSNELVRCWVAEDLLLSIKYSNGLPASTSHKRSKYYRSAFEAGKVVIQALQEYSLLPIYPTVSTPTPSTSSCEETTSAPSSSQDAITGVSKLSEGVPRLRQDKLTTHLNKSKHLGWVSFLNDNGRHVSWDWKPGQTRGDMNMTSLILRGCSNMSAFPLDKLFTPHIHVLDLSHTPINSLPPSFSRLLNLYLLSLRGCSQLKTLSPPPPTSDKQASPLAHLENLEVLDMNGVPLLELTEQDCRNKSNLHHLDLSGSKVTTLPPELFRDMSNLEELILGNCSNLKQLPRSISQLSNLLVLLVEGTQITSFPADMFKEMKILHTLKLIDNTLLITLPRSLSEAKRLKLIHISNCISLSSFPSSMSKAKGLKELQISNCISLRLQTLWELLSFLEDLYIETWEGLEDIKIVGHPNLRIFSLSGPWVRCLSLCGCSKLKSVNFNDDMTALEDVDLSGTAIEEVPHNLPNLPQLNILLLLGVRCFKRFPWHQLVRFPKVFYLDHCANDENQIPIIFYQQETSGDKNQQKENTTNTAQININDPRMFHSFDAAAANKLVKEGQFLRYFTVLVNVRDKGSWNNEVELCARMQRHSTYRDVQFTKAASIMPIMKLQPMQRHVEISAVNQYPNGLRHILSITNSIFIKDDGFIRCLTDLNWVLNELEECQLQRCHQMTVVFLICPSDSKALAHLQRLQVFDLNNLISLVEPHDLSDSTLVTMNLLKHIYLEHCPRLEKMFPCSLSLPALETLVILFCSNLKTIFYKPDRYEVATSPLPNIKRIYLQELPQLNHIHDDVTFRFETPKWEKLFVRGCRSFQSLPLLKMEHPKSKVEVSGEREWWDRMQLQSDYYFHVTPPEFVSRKKHIIESYLR